jgi:hypothetical protein
MAAILLLLNIYGLMNGGFTLTSSAVPLQFHICPFNGTDAV